MVNQLNLRQEKGLLCSSYYLRMNKTPGFGKASGRRRRQPLIIPQTQSKSCYVSNSLQSFKRCAFRGLPESRKKVSRFRTDAPFQHTPIVVYHGKLP